VSAASNCALPYPATYCKFVRDSRAVRKQNANLRMRALTGNVNVCSEVTELAFGSGFHLDKRVPGGIKLGV